MLYLRPQRERSSARPANGLTRRQLGPLSGPPPGRPSLSRARRRPVPSPTAQIGARRRVTSSHVESSRVELGRVGSSWVELGRVGSSWVESGQAHRAPRHGACVPDPESEPSQMTRLDWTAGPSLGPRLGTSPRADRRKRASRTLPPGLASSGVHEISANLGRCREAGRAALPPPSPAGVSPETGRTLVWVRP